MRFQERKGHETGGKEEGGCHEVGHKNEPPREFSVRRDNYSRASQGETEC